MGVTAGTGRVLIAKPGLDGHDRGARLVALALRDAGLEVVYTGLRQTPEQIALAALDEDVDVVGLSILAGGHLGLSRKVVEALHQVGAGDVAVVVGGVIPDEDIPALRGAGVAAVFPSSTPLTRIVDEVGALAGAAARRVTQH